MQNESKKIAALRNANNESKKLTRESIKMALLQLMKDNQFEKISVTAIITRAGVSRAGFYRNYGSKEDVMKNLCASIREKLQEAVDNKEYTQNPYLFYHDLFTAIKSNPVEFRILTDANVPRKYALEALPSVPEPAKPLTSKEYYTFIALLSSLKAITYDWFKTGMTESPDEMAQIMVGLFHQMDSEK